MPTPAKPVKSAFGDRQLAAIVFTDVAGFSSLMEANETRTMVLVQRDLKLIADVCREFGGNVLKNTGDGCLAAFHSVDGAVRTALKIQGIIVDAAHRLPPEKILHHRIGIHLGDVFLGKGDVLGNGVNIAARLLGEAEPDGICISQAVYDVVKHRLGVKAVCIGARELKNIREAMPVYRLLLGAAAEEQGEPAPPVQESSHRMPFTRVIAALLLVAATSAVTWFLIRSRHGGMVNPAAAAASTTRATSSAADAAVASLSILPATQPVVTFQSIQQIMQRPPDFLADSAESWATFPHFENDIQKCGAQDNAYVMTIQSPTLRAAVCSSPWGTFDDVTIEATGRIHEQVRAWWGITLASADGNHKVVRVTFNGNGVMRIDLSHMVGTEAVAHPMRPEELRTFTDRSIRRFDNPNTMVLHVRNHQLSVFANGQLIGKTTDISAVGRASIMLAIDGIKGNQAEISKLRVWLAAPIEPNTGTK